MIQRRVLRAAWLLGVLLAPPPAVGDEPAASHEAVVPPGQEELLAEMLGRGIDLQGGCRLSAVIVDGPVIDATYACDRAEVVVALRHPSASPSGAVRTERFALLAKRGAPAPPGFVDALAARIRGREDAFRWDSLPRPSALEVALPVATVVVPAAAALLGATVLVAALRRRRAPGREQPRGVSARHAPAAVAALRAVGIVAVVVVTLIGAAERGGPPEINLAVSLGVLSTAGFLWLALTGSFGYGSARSADWVALVPFAVALAVRELFTLHSVQEIEIQFARGPIGRHSVLYPLLQMFFAPLVRDTHFFTMHMNGVLGALACLPFYLFVRQRIESRTAGFLAALFLATHPLVTRFSPTDGPYSLLLAVWFSGLALLSTPGLGARELLGGSACLGFAATLRIEGLVFLVASLLLLDPRALVESVRRHPLVAAQSVLVVAALVAVHMQALLLFHLDGAQWPDARHLPGDLLWPIVDNGHVFTALVAIGAVSGLVTKRRLGLLAFLAMLVVVAPVVHSTHPTALHRLVPAAALQSMIAAIGAYALTAWIPWKSWRWAAALPGGLAALEVFAAHRDDLTKPYVFTEEYALVRRHLAPDGLSPPDCTLLSFAPRLDSDVHDFAQVVPDMRVLDCHRTDCVASLSNAGCFFYVRSAACYFHAAGVPAHCAMTGTTADGDRLACLDRPSASLERSVELDPVEVRTIAIRDTFADFSENYPERAEIGLFRVRRKDG